MEVDGVNRDLANARRSLDPAEKNYWITEMELEAVSWAVEDQFNAYVGGPRPFKQIITHSWVYSTYKNQPAD